MLSLTGGWGQADGSVYQPCMKTWAQSPAAQKIECDRFIFNLLATY